MSLDSTSEIRTIPVSDLSFDKAACFGCNDRQDGDGKAIRFMFDAILTIPDHKGLVVKAGSMLFEAEDGSLTLHRVDEFKEQFSRRLKNGCRIKLSSSDIEQLAAIREAEDEIHLKDWTIGKGLATWDSAIDFARDLQGKIITSNVAYDLGLISADFGLSTRELAKNARDGIKAALASPVAVEWGKRLKKLSWGKFNIDQ